MAAFSTVAQQVKLDILSKTHALDNAAKRKEISRTFICESRSAQIAILKISKFVQRTQ
jgi:fructose-1,6-bisphosphatase